MEQGEATQPLLEHLHDDEDGMVSRSGDSMHGASRGWLAEQLQAAGKAPAASAGNALGSPSDAGPQLLRMGMGYAQGAQRHLSRLTSMRQRETTRARRTAWIVIDAHAKRSFLHADKRSLIIQLGLNIPIRDMRLLDFGLLSSETGKLLVRDNAIILSIEHVRLIITADKVLIPQEGYEHNPLSNRFVDVLEESIAEWVRQQGLQTRPMAIEGHSGGGGTCGGTGHHSDYEDDHSSSVHHGDSQALPFELVVMEAALKEVVNAAGMQVKELEAVALPALDALTKSVSSGNLERVRKVKTRHQRLTVRCETLRDELERFLHDDDDMVKMCLTRRKELEEQYKAAERAAVAAAAMQPDGEALQRGVLTPPPTVGSHRTRVLLGMPSLSRSAAVAAATQHVGSPTAGLRDVSTPMLPPGAIEEELTEEAAEDVENLLESYFAQIDAHYDKLRNIGEYIEDTEAYIELELDAGRNRLIRLDIVLTAASFAIAPFNLLAGILGENLVIPPFLTTSVNKFWALNICAFIMCFLFFYSIVLYMRWRKLI